MVSRSSSPSGVLISSISRTSRALPRALSNSGIGRVDVHGLLFLSSLTCGAKSLLAGHVDEGEGSPFKSVRFYAFLVICYRHQVTHGLIVLWGLPASILRASVARGAQDRWVWSHRGSGYKGPCSNLRPVSPTH